MTTPTPEEVTPLRQVAMRLPTDLVARIERHVGRMRLSTPGATLTRADAIRSLLINALDAAENAAK